MVLRRDRAGLGNTFFPTYTRLVIPGTYEAYWSIYMRGFGAPFNTLAVVTPDTAQADVKRIEILGTLDLDALATLRG